MTQTEVQQTHNRTQVNNLTICFFQLLTVKNEQDSTIVELFK